MKLSRFSLQNHFNFHFKEHGDEFSFLVVTTFSPDLGIKENTDDASSKDKVTHSASFTSTTYWQGSYLITSYKSIKKDV